MGVILSGFCKNPSSAKSRLFAQLTRSWGLFVLPFVEFDVCRADAGFLLVCVGVHLSAPLCVLEFPATPPIDSRSGRWEMLMADGARALPLLSLGCSAALGPGACQGPTFPLTSCFILQTASLWCLVCSVPRGPGRRPSEPFSCSRRWSFPAGVPPDLNLAALGVVGSLSTPGSLSLCVCVHAGALVFCTDVFSSILAGEQLLAQLRCCCAESEQTPWSPLLPLWPLWRTSLLLGEPSC